MDPKNNKLKIPSDLSLAAFLSAGLTIVPSTKKNAMTSNESYLQGNQCQYVDIPEELDLADPSTVPSTKKNAMTSNGNYLQGNQYQYVDIPEELDLADPSTVISVPYTVLCILALVFRFQCDTGLASDATGDKYFLYTLYRLYIQADTCNNPLSAPPAGVQLMTPDTVYIFVIITLVASVLGFAAAIVIIVVVAENKSDLVFAITWAYICICASSLVVDITFAAFFGVDYAEMVYTMENTFPGVSANYLNDVLRLGSLLFMTISLKGYFAPMMNIILLIMLAIYATQYRSKLQTDEHSIHKVGAINAYEQQVNRGFVPEAPRRSPRSPRSPARAPPLTPLSDYPNSGDYDRSNSWQHSPAPTPFSYMEEPRRARAAPAGEPQWRRDPWPPAPPLPAPDYSPPPRRLKSALKPNYM